MHRYLDLKILPDPEFSTRLLMNALFSKLHRCLARNQSTDIGLSFPEVDEAKGHLGHVMRLHGNEQSFTTLMTAPWLTGMSDHIAVGEVKQVPPVARSVRVRRVQVDSNPERIRRRQMKRHGWSEEEARRRVPDSVRRTTTLPFLICESSSTGHRFRLFIEHRVADDVAGGAFNAYGLSSTATLPLF